MKLLDLTIATSHVDKHGEMIAPKALSSLVELINAEYLPMGVEHDPRIPPIGRIVSARLVVLDDGAYAVQGVAEMFEDGDQIQLVDNLRELPLKAYKVGEFGVEFDRTYRHSEDQAIIDDIGGLLGAKPQEEIKKALGAISILTIGGGFVLAAVATGFLGKLGADAWDALKDKLKKLYNNRRGRVQEQLLVFEFTFARENAKMVAEVILTNPTDEDIESFFEHGIEQLDRLVPMIHDPSMELRKVVFQYSDHQLSIRFAIRKDAVPVSPTVTGNPA